MGCSAYGRKPSCFFLLKRTAPSFFLKKKLLVRCVPHKVISQESEMQAWRKPLRAGADSGPLLNKQFTPTRGSLAHNRQFIIRSARTYLFMQSVMRNLSIAQ